jgi:hypothetical protein
MVMLIHRTKMYEIRLHHLIIQKFMTTQFYYRISNHDSWKYVWPSAPRICKHRSSLCATPQVFVVASNAGANKSRISTYVFVRIWSNTISFLLVYNAQHKVEAPISNAFLICGPIQFAQSLNLFIKNTGTSILNVTCTTLNKNLAKWQSEKQVLNWFMVRAEDTHFISFPISPNYIIFG